MSVKQMVGELQHLQQDSGKEKKESSEYILSYNMKNRIRHFIHALPLDKTNAEEMWLLLKTLNEYLWSDPCLYTLYSYLCNVYATMKKPGLVVTSASIKTYVTTDNIHQPYYTQLKKRMLDEGHLIGDYSTNRVCIMYMIGEMVGAFLLDGNKVAWSYFETDLVKRHAVHVYPNILW